MVGEGKRPCELWEGSNWRWKSSPRIGCQKTGCYQEGISLRRGGSGEKRPPKGDGRGRGINVKKKSNYPHDLTFGRGACVKTNKSGGGFRWGEEELKGY